MIITFLIYFLNHNIVLYFQNNMYFYILFQAQSDDEEAGGDDVAVNMDGRQDGSGAAFMDKFFEEVNIIYICNLI